MTSIVELLFDNALSFLTLLFPQQSAKMSFNSTSTLGQQALPFPLISATTPLTPLEPILPFTLSERRGSDESEENSDSGRRPSTGRAVDSKDPKYVNRIVSESH